MVAALNGTIRGQTVVLDGEVPSKYDGAEVRVYVSEPEDMTVEERIAALDALCGKGGKCFPEDATAYIRSMRDNDCF